MARAPAPELRRRTLWIAAASLGLVMLLAFGSPLTRRWFDELNTLANSWRFKLRGVVAPDPTIRVVGITQNFISTLAENGDPYPFARDIHALALRRLADAGAQLVVVDIIFSEEGSWEPAEDVALADAIEYCRTRDCEVILAAGIEVTPVQGGGAMESLILPAPAILAAHPRLAISNTEQKLSYKLNEQFTFDLSQHADLPDGYEATDIALSQPAQALSAQHLRKDLTVRVPALKDVQARLGWAPHYRVNYLGPPEQVAGLTYDMATLFPEAFDDARWKAAKKLRDVRNERGLTPSQSNELGQLQSLSVEDRQTLDEVFKGTTVFIGSRNSADNDYFNTPFGVMFGVDTIAQSYDTLLRGRFIRPGAWYIVVLALLALCLLARELALKRPLARAALWGACGLVVYLALNAAVFALVRIDYPLAQTTLAYLLPFLAVTVYSGVVEEAQRKRQYATFSPYLSDELVQQLLAHPDLADLGGRRHVGVVMFNDIRSYSTLTENMDAQQIVQFLNLYLGEMSAIIRRHGGFVDKFMGDGLLAFFGGPVPLPDPAKAALECALEMLTALHERTNPQLVELGLPALRIGVGLHLGEVVMGNIGSVERKNFTVVGDAVNVAARVEGQTKEFGWAILVTREVVEGAPAGFTFRRVGEQKVKGRRQPVELHCLVDPSREMLFMLGEALAKPMTDVVAEA